MTIDTVIGEMTSRKYKVGDRVIGRRAPNEFKGTFVRSYVTINQNIISYRNPAYVIKCDNDGKERSFQTLRKGII